MKTEYVTEWLQSLPQELIPDILVRLPIKSLLRFTSVCKSWNSTIKDPTFIRTHLTHTLNSNHQNLLLLHNVSDEGTSESSYGVVPLSGFKEESYSLHSDDSAFTEHCKIEFPVALKVMLMMKNPCFCVGGSCNGLVLLHDHVCRECYNFILWNPSIRKYVILPMPAVRLSTHGDYKASVGLGYDANKNDYKVVRVTSLVDQPDHYPRTLVQYYSLAKGSWGMLRLLPPCMTVNSHQSLVLVNGALHFLAIRWTDDCKLKYMVMGFDVGSESLRDILLPESLKQDDLLELDLSAYGDGKSIGLFVRCKSDTSCYLDIWVMKEYCVQKSWTKLMILTPQGPERSLPEAKCFRRNGEVVLMLEDDRGLVSLDIVSKQFKSLGISAGLVCSLDSYEESLALVDRKNAITY